MVQGQTALRTAENVLIHLDLRIFSLRDYDKENAIMFLFSLLYFMYLKYCQLPQPLLIARKK